MSDREVTDLDVVINVETRRVASLNVNTTITKSLQKLPAVNL